MKISFIQNYCNFVRYGFYTATNPGRSRLLLDLMAVTLPIIFSCLGNKPQQHDMTLIINALHFLKFTSLLWGSHHSAHSFTLFSFLCFPPRLCLPPRHHRWSSLIKKKQPFTQKLKRGFKEQYIHWTNWPTVLLWMLKCCLTKWLLTTTSV